MIKQKLHSALVEENKSLNFTVEPRYNEDL